MNNRVKREIRNKARLAYCLIDVLEYNIFDVKNKSNECDINILDKTIQEAKTTLQNIVDIIVELEYILYLEKFKES